MAGVTEKKVEYVALTGINLKDGKGEKRFEPGDRIPTTLSQKDVEDLLAVRAIAPKKGGES